MEAQTAQPPSSGSAGRSSSAAYPRWVMLEQYCNVNVGSSSRSAADDANTLAAARTSVGHLIQFSLHLAEPLATSRVYIEAPDGADVVEHKCMVVAAHGDSLLIQVAEENDGYYTTDYFVYSAGDAAADPPQPPSMSLLPPCHLFYPTEEEEEEHVGRVLNAAATGLLRRGEDELVVAELRTVQVEDTTAEPKVVAELCLFRSGEWSVMHLPISYGNTGEVWQVPSMWMNTVVPVGDRQLCWVQFSRDVLVICDDVFEESPRLQYLRLPMDPCTGVPSSWNVCATAGGGGLKFVYIFPRCCCGGAGASNCERSRHAYTIHTWTLRMDDDDGGNMEWVKDGVVDASELWALDAYEGLPRVPLEHPVVSMDEHEPHVVYVQLRESHHVKYGVHRTLWLLKVDTRSKTIQVSRREDGISYQQHSLIPSNVLHFFNSYPSDTTDGALALMGQRQIGMERQQPVIVVDDEQLVVTEDDARNLTLQPSSLLAEPYEQASEFLEAFLEISRYGLGGDELKAYRILSHDNGRRFRSLLRLPKNLRKDWLLMEIKTSQAY